MGESVEDVSCIVAIDAVEIKEQRIQPCQTVAAVVLIPRERCAVITQITRKGSKVVGGVGQAQHFAAHEVSNFGFT